jgi:hypothetical protein
MDSLRSLVAPLFPPTPSQVQQGTQAVKFAIGEERAACSALSRTTSGTTIFADNSVSRGSDYSLCQERVTAVTAPFLKDTQFSSSLPLYLFNRQVSQSIEGIKGTGTRIAAEIAPEKICTGKSDCGSCNSKKA